MSKNKENLWNLCDMSVDELNILHIPPEDLYTHFALYYNKVKAETMKEVPKHRGEPYTTVAFGHSNAECNQLAKDSSESVFVASGDIRSYLGGRRRGFLSATKTETSCLSLM